MTFRLTLQAERDVIDIYVYTAKTFGFGQADAYHARLERTFHLLSDHPYLARERAEIDPPVRVHPCGAHLVIYTVDDGGNVLVIRVRHASEDWMTDSFDAIE